MQALLDRSRRLGPPSMISPEPSSKSGDLIFVVATITGLAAFACTAATSAAKAIVYSDCGLGRDEPYRDLYLRVPLMLVTLAVIALACSRWLSAIAGLARVAALASTGMWAWALGTTWGWW